MKAPFAALLIILAVTLTSGCGGPGSRGQPSEEGAWLGEGTFHAAVGTEKVTAQLEILSDGTYRFLMLEPRVLMMMGVETGEWSRTDELLNLTPSGDQTGGGGLFSQVPKDFRPKTLIIEPDNAAFLLKDEEMDMRFLPNPEATMQLRERGEVD